MENQKNERQFEVIEPTVWKPSNEGDTIEGIYINKKTNLGKYNSNAYYLEVKGEEKEFKQMMVWGNTIIDDKMEFVKVGDLIRITFKKKTKNQKGQDLKIFEVAKAKDLEVGPQTETTIHSEFKHPPLKTVGEAITEEKIEE